MGEGIGSYLQQLRTGRGMTTAQLAQQAGIRRATLSEWQAGKRQPRLPELSAVLKVLGASEAQQRTAQERLRTPAHILRMQQETAAKHQELVEMVGTMPHGGDLIRAMRLRKGWTQEQLAERMGVSQATVVRWERAERWMDMESLHTLCYLLEAHEEELTALMLGRFSLSEKQPALNEEDIWIQLQQIVDSRFSWSDYALAELRLLTLMAHAWSLALQNDAGRSVLAAIFVKYADDLFLQQRFGECRRFSTRAMDIYSTLPGKDSRSDATAIRLAEVSASCGSQQGLESAISLLRHWLPQTSHPSFRGWLLGDLARFHAATGRREEALRLGRESMRVAGHVSDYDDYLHRHYDFIRLLLQVGHIEEAQEKVLAHDHHPYYLLVQAEVAQQAGEQTTARCYVERIQTDLETSRNIDQPGIHYYRPLVETLAESLEGENNNPARN